MLKIKDYIFVLSILLISMLSDYSFAGNIRAFSLREADKLLQDGAGRQELQDLGGITRIAGMVYDRETGDVILIGKVRKDLPAITIDDLAVALRCRLLSDKYPCVSIDMTEETEKTGMQDVRFIGGIEQTQFGSDFLQSDVILKKYSLDLLESIGGVVPYLKQYEADVINTMEINGKSVEDVNWYNEADSKNKVQEYKGKDSLPGKTLQSRFWFHVIEDESSIVEQDDVYVIEELRLGVKVETLGSVENDDKDIQAADISAEEFSRQFTASYNEVCQANPLLKRLKAMFDLVCIAEGVAHLGNDRPDLNYLLGQYTITTAQTPEKYKLVHRVGEFKCDDGDVVLSQLSGGITLEAVLMALEDGDVSGLKIAVLGSRPSKDALCWDLPLDQWKMPNNQPQEESSSNSTQPQKLDVEFPGFSMLAQYFYFPKNKTGLDTNEFSGFKPPVAVPRLQQDNPQLQKHTRLTISSDNAKLQKALLAEDWEKVVDMLQNVTVKTPDPAVRFIKAHACLVINQNNDSFELFASTSNDRDKKEWLSWTKEMEDKNERDAVAWYLRGDALARSKQWDASIKCFSRALEIHPASPIILNARGVAWSQIGRKTEALEDFKEASKNNPDIADIYFSKAMLIVKEQGSAKRALEYLDRALKLSPKHVHAWHMKAMLQMVLGENPEDSIDACNRILDGDSYASRYIWDNSVRVESYWSGLSPDELLVKSAGGDLGTPVNIRMEDAYDAFSNFLSNPTQFRYNRVVEKFGALNEYQKVEFLQHRDQALNKSPYHKEIFTKCGVASDNWNKHKYVRVFHDTLDIGGRVVSMVPNPWTRGGGTAASILGNRMKSWDVSNAHSNDRLMIEPPKSQQRIGGIDINFNNATIDNGEWPFIGYYGLLYDDYTPIAMAGTVTSEEGKDHVL